MDDINGLGFCPPIHHPLTPRGPAYPIYLRWWTTVVDCVAGGELPEDLRLFATRPRLESYGFEAPGHWTGDRLVDGQPQGGCMRPHAAFFGQKCGWGAVEVIEVVQELPW